MNRHDLIPAHLFCTSHHIEISFINDLQQQGLLQAEVIEGEVYMHPEALPSLEKMMHFHYDLDINIEGIESILHLLQKMDSLNAELSTLRNRIRFYENVE